MTFHVRYLSVFLGLTLTAFMVHLSGGFDLSILDRLLPSKNETVAEKPFKKLKVATKKPSKNSSENSENSETSYTFFEVLTDQQDDKIVGIDSSNAKPINKKKVKPLTKDKSTFQSSTHSSSKKQKNVTEKKRQEYVEEKITVANTVVEEQGSLDNGMYIVQAGSFKNMKSADNLVSKLKSKGYSAFWKEKEVGKEKGKWFRVYLGSFSTHEDALMMVQKGRLREKLDPMIIFQPN